MKKYIIEAMSLIARIFNTLKISNGSYDIMKKPYAPNSTAT